MRTCAWSWSAGMKAPLAAAYSSNYSPHPTPGLGLHPAPAPDTQSQMAADAPSPPPPPLGERPAGLVQTGLAAWLRRYRRLVPIPLCVLVLIFLPPLSPLASPGLDFASDILGTAVCLLGQWLRVWAWGSNAVVGKAGVRERGPYALMRHPLYAGNFLIVLGLVLVYHNPWVYPLFLLPFAYLYDAITRMEEQRLHWRFPHDYEGYRQVAVPRFLPVLSHLGRAFDTTRPFGWRLAWRKEYESLCGWLAGIVGIQLYERVEVLGWTVAWPASRLWLGLLALITVANMALKARRRLSQR